MVSVQGTGTLVVPVLDTAKLRTATLPAVEAMGLPMDTPTEHATLHKQATVSHVGGGCRFGPCTGVGLMLACATPNPDARVRSVGC